MKMFYNIAFTLLLFLTPCYGMCEQKDSVVAIVNKDIITNADISRRINLTIALSGMQDSQQTRRALSSQVLQMLIDERLIEREAAKYKIIIDEFAVKQALDRMAAQNKIPSSVEMLNYIKSKGANPEDFKHQLKYQLLQAKLIEAIIEPKINLTDLEIKEFEDQIKRELKTESAETRYHLAEIVLFADEPNLDQLLVELQTQLSLGASFKELAKNFSRSTSAEKGGEVGWLMKSQLPPEVAEMVARTPVGAVTKAIKSEQGYFLIKVLDKKSTGNHSQHKIALDEMKDILWQKKVMVHFKNLMQKIRVQSFVEIK